MGSFINDNEEIIALAGNTSYGEALDCTQKLLVSAQNKVANVGGSTGSITLQVSNVLQPDLTSDVDWVPSSATTTTVTNGTTALLDLIDFPNKWARIKLVAVGGTSLTLDTDYCVKGF